MVDSIRPHCKNMVMPHVLMTVNYCSFAPRIGYVPNDKAMQSDHVFSIEFAAIWIV